MSGVREQMLARLAALEKKQPPPRPMAHPWDLIEAVALGEPLDAEQLVRAAAMEEEAVRLFGEFDDRPNPTPPGSACAGGAPAQE